ncbi:MAG TPA: hypothetical protein VNL70_07065 [Tepidisphaeraceae bacterium]|nr:hypothetical protein [Tepidisphaeraceae bacterium]
MKNRSTHAKTRRSSTARRLRFLFDRNGYVRWQNPQRLAAEKQRRTYKKGDEVRLVARSIPELQTIIRLLEREGFRPGRPFEKARQWALPIYGRQEVARFLKLIGVSD